MPAAAAERVLAVGLSSSQACPSCPAAEAVLEDPAQGDATLLPPDLHVWLVGYDLPARHGPGVNTARTLKAVADWHGAAVSLALALPDGDRAAVLLQDDNRAILSAAIWRWPGGASGDPSGAAAPAWRTRRGHAAVISSGRRGPSSLLKLEAPFSLHAGKRRRM